jgi:hypothetical protein
MTSEGTGNSSGAEKPASARVWERFQPSERSFGLILIKNMYHLVGFLMMEAACASETSVNFYQTTRCYNPEDSHLQNNMGIQESLRS